VDRYDAVSYAAGIGVRSAADLASRVGHAVAIDVAAWSRELLETMLTWEAADQVNPFALLQRAAEKSNCSFPCWENGLVDNFDDEPAAHAVAAVKHGPKDLERPSERPSALFLSYPAILDSTLPARVSNEGLARAAMNKRSTRRSHY